MKCSTLLRFNILCSPQFFLFFGAQSGSKLDSSSAAILVISSSEANSSFSLFLCSYLLLRYSSRFSCFTFLSSVLANGCPHYPCNLFMVRVGLLIKPIFGNDNH